MASDEGRTGAPSIGNHGYVRRLGSLLVIIFFLSPLVAAIAATIVERARRATKLEVLATLPTGSEIIEFRGDKGWWHARIGPQLVVHVVEVEGGP